MAYLLTTMRGKMTPKQLRERIKALGWSQTQAAKALRLTDGAISRYLSGKRPIPGIVQVALNGLLLEKGRTS